MLSHPHRATLALWALIAPHAGAQIATDGTLGSRATLTGPAFSIPATLGQQFGGNLFHSFAQFNLANGESATFSGPGSVTNVLARVTGGASTIDGSLRSSIPGANLYFVNPRGILFGTNARIDVSGGFYASTASHVRLADGGRFDAADPAASVLSSAPPAAFGFLAPPAAIDLRGARLDLAGGRSLSLTGGSIDIRNALVQTRGADLQIDATGSGEVAIGTGAPSGAPRTGGDVFVNVSQIRAESNGAAAPGRLVIRGGTLTFDDVLVRSTNTTAAAAPGVSLEATGQVRIGNTAVFANTAAGGRGASIAITGNDVLIERASSVQAWSAGAGAGGDLTISAGGELRMVSREGDADYVRLFASTLAGGTGGALRLNADAIRLESVGVVSHTEGAGRNGTIEIRGRTVDIAAATYVGSEVRASSTTAASGATIDIAATERLRIGGRDWAGNRSEVSTSTRTARDAGTLGLTAPRIEIDGAFVESFGTGSATGAGGAITVNATGTVDLTGGATLITGTQSARAGGRLQVNAGALGIANGSEVATYSRGAGAAGDVDVRVTGALALGTGGVLQTVTFGSGNAGRLGVQAREVSLAGASFLQNQARAGTGNAGALDVVAERLTLADSSTLNGHTLSAARGRGADLRIDAGEIRLTGGSTIQTDTFGSGAGGALNVTARGTISADASFIASLPWASGHAGAISVRADRIVLANGAKINGASQPGASGRAAGLRIDTGDLIVDRSFVDSGTFDLGLASDITINASRELRLQNQGEISSATWNRFAGGNITIDAPRLVLRGGPIFSRTLADGAGGDVTIRADIVDIGARGTILADSGGLFDGGRLVVGAGNAGKVDITARTVVGIDGANTGISSTTFGAGSAGSIRITAPRLALLNNAIISARTGGDGNAGTIALDVGDLRLSGGASISADNSVATESARLIGSGAAGNITVRASADVAMTGAGTRLQSTTWSDGKGGSIDVEARRVDLRDGAQFIASSGLFDTATGLPVTPSGDAGNIRVVGRESFFASGTTALGGSGLFSSTLGAGAGGRITVDAPRITLDGSALISAQTAGSGRGGTIALTGARIELTRLGSLTSGSIVGFNGRNFIGTGAPGSVSASANERLLIDVGASIRTVSGSAASAGDVKIAAPRVDMNDGGFIQTVNFGDGNAGSVAIEASDALIMTHNASILASAQRGGGGNVTIHAGNRVHLRDSRIAASVLGGAGGGGNISIDPTFVILENGRITANAVAGAGGNIDIRTDYFIASPTSVISASSQFGLAGTISIGPPRSDINAGLKPLSTQLADAGALLRDACGARAIGAQASSSLVAAGRGGLAESPERLTASRYFEPAPGQPVSGASGLRAWRVCGTV